MEVEDDVVNPLAGEPPNDAARKRFAVDWDGGLGSKVGQRFQARAEAGGEHERVRRQRPRHYTSSNSTSAGGVPRPCRSIKSPRPANYNAIVRLFTVRLKPDTHMIRTNTYIVKHSNAKAGKPK